MNTLHENQDLKDKVKRLESDKSRLESENKKLQIEIIDLKTAKDNLEREISDEEKLKSILESASSL